MTDIDTGVAGVARIESTPSGRPGRSARARRRDASPRPAGTPAAPPVAVLPASATRTSVGRRPEEPRSCARHARRHGRRPRRSSEGDRGQLGNAGVRPCQRAEAIGARVESAGDVADQSGAGPLRADPRPRSCSSIEVGGVMLFVRELGVAMEMPPHLAQIVVPLGDGAWIRPSDPASTAAPRFPAGPAATAPPADSLSSASVLDEAPRPEPLPSCVAERSCAEAPARKRSTGVAQVALPVLIEASTTSDGLILRRRRAPAARPRCPRC